MGGGFGERLAASGDELLIARRVEDQPNLAARMRPIRDGAIEAVSAGDRRDRVVGIERNPRINPIGAGVIGFAFKVGSEED